MTVALFLVGPPGVGKTTTVRQLLDAETYLVQKPKWTVGDAACAAGHYVGGTFDGADTVPYNGVKECLAFWECELSSKALTIFDGDRFSNRGVIDFFRERKVRVLCAHVTAPAELLEARRKQRGSNQNATWLKGRETKATNFLAFFSAPEQLVLDGMRSTAHLANELRDAVYR